MASVTQRIRQIAQPRGGYISPKSFEVTQLKSERRLYESENIAPSLVGLAVDYLTRLMCGYSPQEVFMVSRMGAQRVGELPRADQLLQNIRGLDSQSIDCTCKLVDYDTFYRRNLYGSREIPNINPNQWTTENIQTMVTRSLAFLKQYGPVISSGFTFHGGYSLMVDSGDGDYLTQDTLWDFKVSRKELSKETTLQLAMYYLLGKRSGQAMFAGVTKVGAFNPRMNKVYTLDMSTVSQQTLEIISRDVLGPSYILGWNSKPD